MASPKKKTKKVEEEEFCHWREEEEKKVKWETLQHNGPYFPLKYEILPENICFVYDGKPLPLSVAAEEVTLEH